MRKLLALMLLSLLYVLSAGAQSLNNVVPDFSPATFAPYTITVNGNGFTGDATVLWEGIPLNTTFVSSSQLAALVPCCFSGSVSTVHIVVVQGNGTASSPVIFRNLGNYAPITSYTPSIFHQGIPSQLSVRGNYFISGSQIYFDNQPQNTTFVSQYQLTANISGGSIDGRTRHNVRVQYPPVGTTVRLTPPVASFGSVIVNSSPTLSVSLANLVSSPLTITSIVKTGAAFSQTNNCFSPVAPYSGCGFTVTFTPTSIGTFTGQITITDSGLGSPHIISLTGQGVGGPSGPVATFDNTSFAFGSVAVGSSSSPQTLLLTNTGGSAMTISSVVLGGTNSSSFSMTDGCVAASPLAASASCNVTAITFSPLSAGPLSATITFTDSAANSPQVISLTGTGTSTHSVDVAWVASVSAGVTGYNIYRGTVSGGPYSQVNATLVSGTAYTDHTVSSGVHYCYVVTSYAPSGYNPQESVYSVESCTTVP
jgi:hypothetical protein